MRDPYILNSPDGYYYLTGTTKSPDEEHVWSVNDGIRLWRSKDLDNWESMGLVWSFEEHASWQNQKLSVPKEDWEYHRVDFNGNKIAPIRRAVWAPEIHYIKGNYYITASMNWVKNPLNNQRYGTFLLKSSTGRPEGPYKNVTEGPLTEWIDSSLFEDEDGSVYYIWLDGRIAKMKPDLSGFAEKPTKLIQQNFEPEPYSEGAFIFKKDGRYFLILSLWAKKKDGKIQYSEQGQLVNYNVIVASSHHIYGPYNKRYTAIQGAGHNNVFKDKKGNWWSTYFGNPKAKADLPFVTRPGLIKLIWKENRFYPDPNQ